MNQVQLYQTREDALKVEKSMFRLMKGWQTHVVQFNAPLFLEDGKPNAILRCWAIKARQLEATGDWTYLRTNGYIS